MASQVERIKWVPGTSFMVDGFQFQNDKCQHYFLTHYHSDHTTGLTKRFNRGVIYCSPLTGKLLVEDMGVAQDLLEILPLDSEVTIEGVRVTLMDANHCPGAAMILFQVPLSDGQGSCGGGYRTILHTGDMRWQSHMADHPALQGLKIDILFLDTTYCQPKYTFPPQDDAISVLVDVFRRHAVDHPATLFVIGAYRIGKERLFLKVAQALGWSMWCCADKRKILHILPLSADQRSLFVDDPSAARIHITFMGADLRPDALQDRIKEGCWTHCVGVRPTGWSFRKSGLETRRHGCVTVYGIPYSEHSSFLELRDCVKRLRPTRIVPTVNVATPSHSRRLVDKFADLMDLSQDKSRLDCYFAGNRKPELSAACTGSPLRDDIIKPDPCDTRQNDTLAALHDDDAGGRPHAAPLTTCNCTETGCGSGEADCSTRGDGDSTGGVSRVMRDAAWDDSHTAVEGAVEGSAAIRQDGVLCCGGVEDGGCRVAAHDGSGVAPDTAVQAAMGTLDSCPGQTCHTSDTHALESDVQTVRDIVDSCPGQTGYMSDMHALESDVQTVQNTVDSCPVRTGCTSNQLPSTCSGRYGERSRYTETRTASLRCQAEAAHCGNTSIAVIERIRADGDLPVDGGQHQRQCLDGEDELEVDEDVLYEAVQPDWQYTTPPEANTANRCGNSVSRGAPEHHQELAACDPSHGRSNRSTAAAGPAGCHKPEVHDSVLEPAGAAIATAGCHKPEVHDSVLEPAGAAIGTADPHKAGTCKGLPKCAGVALDEKLFDLGEVDVVQQKRILDQIQMQAAKAQSGSAGVPGQVTSNRHRRRQAKHVRPGKQFNGVTSKVAAREDVTSSVEQQTEAPRKPGKRQCLLHHFITRSAAK